MTTPQKILSDIEYGIRRLSDLFEADENGETIFDEVSQIKDEVADLAACMARLEINLNLLAKAWLKEGEKGDRTS